MKRQKIDLYLRLSFLFLGTLAAMLSLKTYISDSEFWAITASRQLGEAGVSSSIYVKFLFYGLLKPIYLLPLDNISHVLVARLEFALIGAFTAYVFYRVARLALEDEFWGLILTLVLVTSTYFLSQSFRVRSDNLSSLIALLIFWILLLWSKRRTTKWIAPALGIFVLNILLLITTPKAFYFLILGGLFATLLPFANLEIRRKVLALGVAFLAPPFVIISTVQVVSFFPAFRWVERAAIVAFEYFDDSFNGLSGANTYLTHDDFAHVFSFLAQNPLHDMFFVASAWLWARESRRHEFAERRAYFALFIGSVALLIFHNQKLPFFIYAMLPMLILGSGLAWRSTLANFVSTRAATIVVVVITLAGANLAWMTSRTSLLGSNSVQIESLRDVQDFLLENPTARYYDTIGLFPRLNSIYAFPSPNDRNNATVMKVVENSNPDIILYVTRTLELEPRMSFFLSEAYVNLGGGVWVRAITPKRLENIIERTGEGRCRTKVASLQRVISDAFGASLTNFTIIEIDNDGFRSKFEADSSNSQTLSWQCENSSIAVVTTKPRELKWFLDLRSTFGFDYTQPLR